MYEPAAERLLALTLLWPAFAAASVSEWSAQAARQFAEFAIGPEPSKADEPQWATPHRVVFELEAVRLRDFTVAPEGTAALLCAPLASHSAAIADFAPGHSLVEALLGAGVSRVLVTDWRSATADMRLRGIDDYLADLNVLVDEIGMPVDLIGLCQGGWLALIYTARFPSKVRRLVLAGAPIDTAAAASPLSAIAGLSPPVLFQTMARLGEGLILGREALKFWGADTVSPADMQQVLQVDASADPAAVAHLEATFRRWYAWTLDLPGRFFLEVAERLYRRNELAGGEFVALGRRIDLKTVTTPLFLLAASDDELVAPAQLLAVESLVGTSAVAIASAIAAGRHVSLFMGRRNLREIWPGIGRWLAETCLDQSANAQSRQSQDEQWLPPQIARNG